MKNLERPFMTRDMYLTSFLCFHGMTLLDPAPAVEGQPRQFVLVDREDREDLVEQWISGAGDAIICKKYAAKLRMVKRALYGDKQRG